MPSTEKLHFVLVGKEKRFPRSVSTVTKHCKGRVNSTVRYHFTHIRMAVSVKKMSKRQIITSVDKRVEQLELSYIIGRNGKWCSCFGTVWKFLKWLNMDLLYRPAFPLLGIYSKEMKIYVHMNTYISIHSNIVHNSQKVETTPMSIN